MNNSNYGYPPSGYTSPYSSTPSNIRPPRTRFGYSGPTFNPRPRSSASKPNHDSFSESMTNNYDNSTSRIDNFNSENPDSFNNSYSDSYNNSYKNDSSTYYSANDSFYPNQPSGDVSGPIGRGNMGLMRETPLLPAYESNLTAPVYSSPATSRFQPKFQYRGASLGVDSNAGGFQKTYSSTVGLAENKFPNQSFSARKFGKAKRGGMTSKQGAWKCTLCNLDFTSQIPYDMHLRGARHARKMKSQNISINVQSQGIVGQGGETSFFCAVCNVTTNSTLQYQTHLEGSKHKNKLNPKDPKEETEGQAKKDKLKKAPAASTNGKTNGSLTRTLPADFGEVQPAKIAKVAKFSCDICNVIVNSDVQLQQHLSSKKHQNKVEGKPVVRKSKNKTENQNPSNDIGVKGATPTGEAVQKVVGVKTLASSFVQGETLN